MGQIGSEEDQLTVIGLILGFFILVTPRLLFPVSSSQILPMVAEFGLTAIRIKIMDRAFANLYTDFTLAQYNQLKQGMHLLEVESILGTGIELKPRPNSVSTARKTPPIRTYAWYSSKGSQIILTFEEFRLKEKEQVGLASS